MPLPNLVDHCANEGVFGNDSQAGIDEFLDIGLNKGLGFHSGQHLRAVNGDAVVGDACGAPRQIGSQLRVSRRDHGPPVYEDLGPNLLSHDLAVQGHRTALRGGSAFFQTQVGCMLGRVSHPSPPQDRAFFDYVVQPALPDLRRRDGPTVAIVRQGAQKGECAGNVVVGDDKRHIQMLVDVVVDFAKLFVQHFIAPAFKRPPQIDADQLTQYTGVDSFGIVAWNRHHIAPGWCASVLTLCWRTVLSCELRKPRVLPHLLQSQNGSPVSVRSLSLT